MLKSLYHWMLEKARHRHARYWLCFVSCIESVIFPIPPDVMLLPMAIAHKQKAYLYALYCTIGGIIGAAIGYCIGLFFYDLIGAEIIALYDKGENFAEIKAMFQEYDWLVILAAAVTPIPMKIATITAGFSELNFVTFILAVCVGRGLRYFLISLLVVLFGEKIEHFLENHFTLAVTLAFIVFILGWVLVLR